MLALTVMHDIRVTPQPLDQPVLAGDGDSDYERYLRTDALLALQGTPGERRHRDELLFTVVHQSSELWLKLAWTEALEAAALVARDELSAALRLLRRSSHGVELVTDGLHVLEHMSPWEYQEVRRALGHGSGFDSPGFRGIRQAAEALEGAFDALLARRELTVLELYLSGREHEELYQLAERLIEWDERLILWRMHHVKVVERIIGGAVVGTQGTPVEVLGRLVHHTRFPELWKVRNELTERAMAEE
jgi:tryptophan 2,3-dioxygenase